MFYESIRLDQPFKFSSFTGNWATHELHIHDCLEIGVITANRVKYRIGDHEYVGTAGDVFLLRPFEPHWCFSCEGEDYGYQMLLFHSSAVRSVPDGEQLIIPFYSWADTMSPCIPAETEAAQTISICMNAALMAGSKQQAGWNARQYASFIQILISIYDLYGGYHSAGTGNRRIAADTVAAFKGVQVYLSRYQEPIAAEDGRAASGLTRTAYHQLFRQLTGLTPHVFLSRIRVHAAMDLLANSGLSMIEICEESGFLSLSTFNKQFKNLLGCSPSAYRQQAVQKRKRTM
ncbi:AraC-like DNA-binding protein [Paenibacillus rhizosphaerae]|uniref:AraC-like DNA-binding protein n=1 Tax=Paenibacillus rhizosphaerae TaxID=297318 RepID=A0A839TT58_9BACL|nr:helix-turn-helix transcriptional regulator [Paenibacillus rhizosphaerae]MBB3128830.1 AraC-like DNA-binding protein [Paenibacillus rhizosphaerae]